VRFCRLIGAEPYFAANVRSLPARDFYQWIEYCNSPANASTLGERRAAWGDAEPFNIRYWGIGNESWGCGGNMTAEEYSVEFRKFIGWTPNYGTPLHYIPAGPNGADYNWTRGFFSRLVEKSPGLLNQVWGWALHYYCGRTGRGDSVNFDTNEYYELLDRAGRMNELITRHWAAMGDIDREHKVKLVVDEWGAWHNDGTAVAPHHLFGSIPTMRDALVAALTLDIFNRHADKVAMANVAQLVNCIQTLFLANEDKFCVTPTYHVFAMFRDHQKGQSLRTEFAAPQVGYTLQGKQEDLARLAGSATRTDTRVVITAAHTGHQEPLEATIRLHGGTIREARAQVLSGPEMQAHNTFEQPERVKPKPAEVRVANGSIAFVFPPASVVKFEVVTG
jgi:alpha-N-arabinofuranosidase